MNGDVVARMRADVARVVCDKRLQRYLFAGNNIDYGIVLSGEVELELDDGAVTTARSGDIIVQRVTMHLRRNPSATETCWIFFVLIEANPVVAVARHWRNLSPRLASRAHDSRRHPRYVDPAGLYAALLWSK